MLMKIIAVDFDGVLCNEGGFSLQEFFDREPIRENISKVNKLLDDGNFIVIYTARRNTNEAVTKQWLGKFQVKYDLIIFDNNP